MTRDQIIAAIRACERQIKAEGVEHLALFGSRMRGDDRPDSDVDVLIDVPRGSGFSLLNLSGVGLLIQQAVGIPAQVTLRRSLDPEFAQRIADDLVEVF